VAVLRASADGKRLWLQDEDGTALGLEGVPPAPQTLNRVVAVPGGTWNLLRVARGGERCLLSAAVRVLGEDGGGQSPPLCAAAVGLARGPPPGASLPASEPVDSVSELLAASKSRKRDRRGAAASKRRAATWVSGRVVGVSPVIQPADGPPTCFLVLEDTASATEPDAAPEAVPEATPLALALRATLVLSGSALVWRRFVSCEDCVVVTAVHTRHSRLEVASGSGGAVERFAVFATSEAPAAEAGQQLSVAPRDWVATARAETILVRISPSYSSPPSPTRDPGVASPFAVPSLVHVPRLDTRVVHYTGMVTGARALASLSGRVGASAKHLLLQLDQDGLLLFLQHWPPLADAASCPTFPASFSSFSSAFLSPSSPSSASAAASTSAFSPPPPWASWLAVGATLRLRHVHPVYMWGKLRGYAACAATEITPLDVSAALAAPAAPAAASAAASAAARGAAAAQSLGKAYISRSGADCCGSLAWARLVERNLGTHHLKCIQRFLAYTCAHHWGLPASSSVFSKAKSAALWAAMRWLDKRP
jgi:hypothetical protein